jgi:hypothetical protein
MKEIRMAGSPATYQEIRSDFSAQAVFTPAAAAYGAGDIMEGAKAFAFGAKAAGELKITGYNFMVNASALQASEDTYQLHLYSVTPPSALADNAAFDIPSGDRASYLGYITIDAPVDLGSTLWGEKIFSVPKQITVPAGGTVYGYLRTVAGFTATAVARTVTLKAEAV